MNSIKTMKYKNLSFLTLIAGVLLLSCAVLIPKAFALFLSPDRLIIEDGQRSAELVISNRGNKTMLVTFEWERRGMLDGGSMKLLAEGETIPNYQPADPFLRFSPRQTILRPKQHQKIRVLVRRTDDMAPGEYHSHLLVKEEPVQDDGQAPQSQAGKMSGQFQIIVNRSVPVFVRQGETVVSVDVADAYVHRKKNGYFLHVGLTNNSTRSVYANPVLSCKTADGKASDKTLTAVRIYTEAKTIQKDVPLGDWYKSGMCSGGMSVSFYDRKDHEYKNKPIATVSVNER